MPTFCAAILVRSLLAQDRIEDAKAAADRVLVFSQRTSDRGARFTAALAVAEVSARLLKTTEATRALETVRTEVSHYGYTTFELEARLHLGELEVRSGKASTGERIWGNSGTMRGTKDSSSSHARPALP
jgi:hypothetical protein